MLKYKIKKFYKLYFSTRDVIAFKFVGRVLAQRCLESGISEIYVNNSIAVGSKIQLLLDTLSENGICLKEPERYKVPKPGILVHPEKPWEIYEQFLIICECYITMNVI